MKRRKRTNWTPLAAIVIVGLVAAVVYAQTTKHSGLTSPSQVGKTSRTAPAHSLVVAVGQRKPLDFYVNGVRPDMFTPAAPAPVVTKVDTKPIVFPEPTPPPNPFADYAYTGTIDMGTERVALIENSKTKDGQYLKVGDEFMGGKIASIDDRSVQISMAGKNEMLAKSDEYKLTPLDKNAPYLTAQPGTPGQPGAPGVGPNGMPLPPGFANLPPNVQAAIQARMQSMTPEQQQQMQQRMLNRQFNGGGGRGGGGGRRGGGGGGRGGFGGGGFGGFGG